MIEFTTSKGSFIAVPVPENAIIELYRVNGESVMLRHTDPLYPLRVHDVTKIGHHRAELPLPFEIIGLSSDILKDEELASKVCECGLLTLEYHEFQSICERHNITGNNLIIKKHGN